MTGASFNLAYDSWLPVQGPSGTEVLSLRDLLVRAHELSGLSIARPLAAVMIVRYCVALTKRVFEVEDPYGFERLWRRGSFDADRIDAYFDEHSGRFELFGEHPFMQVAGLESTSGAIRSASTLRLTQSSGNNVPLFDAMTDGDELVLPCAEAALCLVEVLGWDTAAIKTGAAGDPKVSGGKTSGNPTGPVGQLGVVLPMGRNVFETLMLSLPLGKLTEDDLPNWELDGTPTWQIRQPKGVLDLLTWRSRAIRLVPTEDGSGVDGVVLAAGDRLQFMPAELEPHTRWQQTKRGNVAVRPVRWWPGRAAWRGLQSLLALNRGDEAQTARVLAQLREYRDLDLIPDDYPLNLLCVGIEYGNMSAVIEDVFVDSLPLPLVALRSEGEDAARIALVDLVERAESIRRALNDLENNIRIAAGGDKHEWNKGGHLGDETMPMLDLPTWELLAGLQRHPDGRESALLAWDEKVAQIARLRAEGALNGAPVSAFAGRETSTGRVLRLADAEAYFGIALYKALPNLASKSRKDRGKA